MRAAAGWSRVLPRGRCATTTSWSRATTAALISSVQPIVFCLGGAPIAFHPSPPYLTWELSWASARPQWRFDDVGCLCPAICRLCDHPPRQETVRADRRAGPVLRRRAADRHAVLRVGKLCHVAGGFLRRRLRHPACEDKAPRTPAPAAQGGSRASARHGRAGPARADR